MFGVEEVKEDAPPAVSQTALVPPEVPQAEPDTPSRGGKLNPEDEVETVSVTQLPEAISQ